MKDIHKIKDLDQVRLLSDPLKLRLLQAFAESPRTTKQVAAELGESVTKLYRHVDALQDAGLIEIVDETRKRGTIQRTFRAVAQRFEADHSLFSDTSANGGAEAARDMLRVTETEILDALAKAGDDDEDKAVVMRFRGKATPDEIAALRKQLADWLDALPNDDRPPAEDAKEFGGLVAFYQID